MIYKAFKYRLYPNKEQQELIAKHIGCSRWIYNYALNKKAKSYQETGKGLSRFDIQKDLPFLKKDENTYWLKEVNSQTLQASLENMDKAFTKFFKEKKGFPKFKSKKDNHQSFSIPQNTIVDFENEYVNIPKFKTNIKCRLHRKFDGIIKTSTISIAPTGKYYISILVELNEELPKKKPISEKQAIGIDLGIKTFATLSDGIEIENPKHLKNNIQRLKVLQKRASKKQKGSANRKKANLKVARLHEKIANQRLDFLHKTTTAIAKQYDTVACENLNISGMLRNHKLAQSIADLGLGKFYTLLQYKMAEQGGNYLEIGRFEPSSKMCGCGAINKNLKLSDREWVCPVCGRINQRDELASRNILKFALTEQNKLTAGTVGRACGGVGVSRTIEAGTIDGRSLRS